MSDKKQLVLESEIKLTLQSNGWKLNVVHKDGGTSARIGTFPSIKDAAEWVKDRYEVP